MTDPRIVARHGRWMLAGSGLWVATIAHALRAWDRERIKREYPAVTDAEIDAAQAWTFPALTDAPMVEVDRVELRCVCGEWTLADAETIDGSAPLAVACAACGRSWRVTVSIAPA